VVVVRCIVRNRIVKIKTKKLFISYTSIIVDCTIIVIVVVYSM